jgi:Secretion system C-terminal sorting domain
VSLVVRNAATGCYDSSSQVVTISAPSPQCSIGFYYGHDSTSINSPYSFYASPYLAGATSDSVTWTINGSLAGYGNILNRVLPPGQYTVCASLSTSLGCRTQSCQSIFVTDSGSTPPVVIPPDTAIITVPPNIPPDSNVTVPPDSTGRLPVDTAYWPPLDSLANYLSSYPNPVSGQVHMELKTDRAEMIYIRVYNSMGGMIKTVAVPGIQGANQLSLNVSNWQSGIYYIQIQYGNEIKRSRIQKL